MRRIDICTVTLLAVLGGAGCSSHDPISKQSQGRGSTIGGSGGGGGHPSTKANDTGTRGASADSCTAGSKSIPYVVGDPCPQDDPKCPAAMYEAVATCGADGTWAKDAFGSIMCACIPKIGTGTGGVTDFRLGAGGAPGFMGFQQGDNRGAGVCDCDGEHSDFSITVSLECACNLAGCKPHDHPAQLPSFDCARANQSPTFFDPSLSYFARGCGLVAIMTSHSTGGTALVFRESDHELVGAAVSDDTPWGICRSPEYMTANVDLSQCPDYTICSPCPPGGIYPLCADGDVDAGM